MSIINRGFVVAAAASLLCTGMEQTARADHDTHAATRTLASRVEVTGTVRARGGHILAGAQVFITLIDSRQGSTVLGHVESNGRGHFHMSIARTPAVRSFAAAHGGCLNVIVWAKKHRFTHVRAMSIAIDAPRGLAPILDVPIGSTRLPLAARIERRSSRAPRFSGGVRRVQYLPEQDRTVARLSAARGVTASLSYHTDLETQIKTELTATNVPDGWSDGGSFTLGNTEGVGLSATLDSPGRRATDLAIRPAKVETCVAGRGWAGCWNSLTADWTTGRWNEHKAPSLNCDDLDGDNVFWFRVGKVAWHPDKVTGTAFITTQSVGIPGVSLTLSTAHTTTNSQSWSFPSRGHTAMKFYCIGGTDAGWTDASDVVTQGSTGEPPPCDGVVPPCRRIGARP